MIILLDLLSIGAPFTGLYYLLKAARDTRGLALAEVIGFVTLLCIISGLALAASYVGMTK
jgi:hypothetical protein